MKDLMLDELLTPLFSTRWGHQLGLACLIALSVLFLFLVGSAPFTWWSDIKLAKAPLPSRTVHVPDDTRLLIAQVPVWHLFGNSLDQSAVPITSLQLRLMGIIKAVPEKFSRVIISEGGQPGKVYRMGDSIDGVKVYSITQDGVILENAGRFEKLPLQRQPLEFQGMPKPLLGE